jgi:hypothetical protein
MARPGLEPGTPRFSVLGPDLSNWPEIPGKQRVLGLAARRSNSSLFAVFCAGIGYPDRTRYPMRAMRSSLPTSERLSSRRCVGMVGTSQHVAGAVGSHSSQCLVHQQCLAGRDEPVVLRRFRHAARDRSGGGGAGDRAEAVRRRRRAQPHAVGESVARGPMTSPSTAANLRR